MMNLLRTPGGIALLGVLVAILTVAMAAAYAARPSERRLGLMRPLSLATIFAALCSFTVGISHIFQGISATAELTAPAWRAVAAGAAEAFVPLILAFGSLTIAWILVAVGLRRA